MDRHFNRQWLTLKIHLTQGVILNGLQAVKDLACSRYSPFAPALLPMRARSFGTEVTQEDAAATGRFERLPSGPRTKIKSDGQECPSHTIFFEVLLQVIQQARRQNLGCGRQRSVVRRGGPGQVRCSFGQVCTHQIVGLRFQRYLFLLQEGLGGGQLVDRVSVEDPLAGQRVESGAKLVGGSAGGGREFRFAEL